MTPQLHHSITGLVLLALIRDQALAQSASDARSKRFDQNADGRLTTDKFPYPVVFKQLDLDGDGALSPQEAEGIPASCQTRLPSFAPAPKLDATSESPPAAMPPGGVPRSATASTGLARLAFTQDYFPGGRDARGNFMGGREAMWLAGHDGKLFAAIGYAPDQPGGDPRPGAQILRKDGPDAPWQVDHQFAPDCMWVEGLISFAFTTDHRGQKLAQPVRKLVASPSELQRSSTQSAVFIRDDATGKWLRSDIASGNLGVRSFGSHVDRVTGVHHLFAGLNRGGIVRGSYDPSKPGGIRWEAESERDASAGYRSDGKVYDFSRVLCFAE